MECDWAISLSINNKRSLVPPNRTVIKRLVVRLIKDL